MTAFSPDHPSDLQLDALHLGELPVARGESIHAHLDACRYCAQRMQLRSSAFAELDPDRMVTRLVGAVPERPRWPARALGRRLLVPMTACAAAALVLLVVLAGPFRPAGPGDRRAVDVDSVRAKGARPALRVFRDERGGGVEQRSGGTFHPGDRIRFHVDAGGIGPPLHIAIVGVEASGRRSIYYPAATDEAARVGPAQVRADGALAGAIELDDYMGEEWLYAVACPHPFALAEVVVRAPGAEPRVPGSMCGWRSFLLVKKSSR